MTTKLVFLFANLAGAARTGAANPYDLGNFLASHWWLTKQRASGAKLVLISASEVVRADAALPCLVAAPAPAVLPVGAAPVRGAGLDDMAEFCDGLTAGGIPMAQWRGMFVSVLNSRDYCSARAAEAKWLRHGRFHPALSDGRVVHQGLCILTHPDVPVYGVGWLLRCAGPDRDATSANDPLAFAGNRDTEPRGAARVSLCVPGSALGSTELMHVCVTQLETHSADGDPRPRYPKGIGADHRKLQAEGIAQHFGGCGTPILALGDWNCLPDAPELTPLCAARIAPVDLHAVIPTPGAANTAEKVVLSAAQPPDQYTHLKHQLLVDHAFVRALPAGWSASLYAFELPGEALFATQGCYSDHRPIAVVLEHP